MARHFQYRSKLEPAQIAAGMTRALENAERLAEDAAFLLNAGRTPSAVALAILSIEESGKESILRQMATATEEKEWAALWKAYRSHTKKNTLWIFGELVKRGAKTIDELRSIADPKSDHPDILDQLKQLSFYTDCFNNAKWSSPAEVELDTVAPYLVKMAQIFGRARTVAAEEIELWQKHMLPVKYADLEAQKVAVAAWFKEMELAGLSRASADGIEAFLGRDDASANC